MGLSEGGHSSTFPLSTVMSDETRVLFRSTLPISQREPDARVILRVRRMPNGFRQSLGKEKNRRLRLADAQSFDETFGAALNGQRAALGLTSVAHVARH